MDINGFREPQSPWFFSQPPTQLVDNRNRELMTKPEPKTLPTQDSRYPGWAAHMNDGRLSTDYRTHCEVNIPTGSQYASRLFMQRNGVSLINQARRRQAQASGAGLAYDSSTILPAAQTVSCDVGQCVRVLVNPYGLGTERNEVVPELFGTFSESHASLQKPAKPAFTRVEEGGRNTRR
jgi:hypothetical protein